MAKFFKATFTMNVIDEISRINLPVLCGIDADNGQQFIVGKTEDFAQVIECLCSRNMCHDFDRVDFGQWYDLGDDATLKMVHDWESLIKEYSARPKRVGIHYVYNGEPFDTLYHASEYVRDCDLNISDDNSEYCESIGEINPKDETAFLI